MKWGSCQPVILLFLSLSVYAAGAISDEKWLKMTDDIDHLANVGAG